MGFISSGDTTILNAYYTQRGRELLLNGSETDSNAVYFALGDSDTNYKINILLNEGFVPDLTGDNIGCVISLAQNQSIKHPIQYKNDPIIPNNQTYLQRTDNNQYYSVLNCQINLDSIGRYQLYNSSSNLSNPNRLKANNNISSSFIDLFNRVAILVGTGNTINPSSSDFAPDDNIVFEMLFDPNIFKSLSNTYLDTTSTNVVNQTGGIVSPLQFTFSSLIVSGNTYFGEGKGSIGIFGREIGYLFKPFDSINNSWSFYSASNFEGVQNYTFITDANNQLTNSYSDFTLAARIYSRDVNSGLVNTYIYRGDKNLTNISDSILNTYSDDLKIANQYTKLFADDYPVINNFVSTTITEGLVQKEISNLSSFIKSSNIFSKLAGTNEYRSSKLSFSVYPKTALNTNPATLNIIFRYNEDILMNGDPDTSHISDSGDTQFIIYDFVSTNGVFKNTTKTGTFLKNNCGVGYTGSQYIYTVPAGTYTGVTQTIADTLATNDVNTNGQTQANLNGICSPSTLFLSQVFSQNITKNDCPINYVGNGVPVYYPQGQFTSYISQLDADNQALFAAQQYANAQGTCTYVPPYSGGCLLAGQKILINEFGDLVNIENLNNDSFVYTAHEKTNEIGYYPVISTYKGTVNEWYLIETENKREIKCSPTHLFMVNHEPIEAKNLTLNDSLIYFDNEFKEDKIKNITIVPEVVNIYNIEVEQAHTYFTENMIWQHNKQIAQNI